MFCKRTLIKLIAVALAAFFLCGCEKPFEETTEKTPPTSVSTTEQGKKTVTVRIALNTGYFNAAVRAYNKQSPDYEVELIASGDSSYPWLVKVKKTGLYMYYANSKITFTEDASLAKQSIMTNSNTASGFTNSNNDQFYHSGSGECFMYANAKNANNLRFFKVNE